MPPLPPSESESVWASGCAARAVIAVEAVGVDPLARQAVGEAGSPLVVPVLRLAWAGRGSDVG